MASRLTIKLDKRNLNKIFGSLDKLRNIAITEREQMPKKGSEDYARAVLSAINSVRWSYRSKYNKRYKDWKNEYTGGLHVPWKLAGDLIKVLRSYREGNVAGRITYIGGVKPGIYDRGGKSWHGKKGIAMYGRAVEKTKPMFVPIFNEYQKRWDALGRKVQRKQLRAWG